MRGLAAVLASVLAAPVAWAETGSALFEERCSGCHTIGRGVLAGPDLATVSGRPEADLAGAVRRMAEMSGGLDDAQVAALVAFLRSGPRDAAPAGPAGDPARDLYAARCATCHTVGGGPGTGPDLEASTRWTPADRRAAVERMERYTGPLAEAEIAALVDLLGDARVRERLAGATAAGPPPPPGDPARGGRLFRGEAALREGGMPCASCHAFGASGGSLARDLAGAAARLGPGLEAGLRRPGWPLMRAAYARAPLADDEARDLAAYLSSPPPDGRPAPLAPWSAGLAALGIAAVGLITRRRSRRRIP